MDSEPNILQIFFVNFFFFSWIILLIHSLLNKSSKLFQWSSVSIIFYVMPALLMTAVGVGLGYSHETGFPNHIWLIYYGLSAMGLIMMLPIVSWEMGNLKSAYRQVFQQNKK